MLGDREAGGGGSQCVRQQGTELLVGVVAVTVKVGPHPGPRGTPTHRIYCFLFILQNMIKPLTHFFFVWVGQEAFLFSLGFAGPFLTFLPAAGRLAARRVGVHV